MVFGPGFPAGPRFRYPRAPRQSSSAWSFLQVKDIGSGNFGVAKLMRDRQTGELVAVKFIERGEKVVTHVDHSMES